MKSLAILFLWSFLVPVSISATIAQEPVPLCRALERLGYGDQIRVVVSGVYTLHYFYDSAETACRLDVDPTVCIEFVEGLEIPSDFAKLHEKSRVHATFSGVLHGPIFDPQMNDPSIPVLARISALAPSRHCGNTYRVKLVVESILDFDKVPRKVSWKLDASNKKEIVNKPFPKLMELPGYPEIARTLEAEGRVLVEVTVLDGIVVEIGIQFGDSILVEEAVANLKTWRFEPSLSTRLNVEFDFRLERRPRSEGANPRYEMQLPTYIKVIGAQKGR